MHYVQDATYLTEYKIEIKFETGEIRIVDLANQLHGSVFEPLRELTYFKQFTVNHDIDTIVWPNHADFSPDFLYEIGESIHTPLYTVDLAK